MARPHARISALDEVVRWLASPDTGKELRFTETRDALTDGTSAFALRNGLPILLPSRLVPFFTDHLNVPATAATDAFLRYFALSTFRHQGEINAPASSIHFQRHLHRMQRFVEPCQGVVLDIGCDDAAIGSSLFNARSVYVGVDPFCRQANPFRIVGVGEFLPFRDGCVDVAVFNTSLDHIFDWRRAVNEAHRVLRAGGQLVIASLVWTSKADLLTDDIHFHHFREYDIFGALADFTLDDTARYHYKDDSHRYGLYVRATKR